MSEKIVDNDLKDIQKLRNLLTEKLSSQDITKRIHIDKDIY